MDRCRREGTPRPESSAVRAHVPAAFWSFANSWRDIFQQRRVRAPDQGALPALRVALGAVRLLRQPALDQGGERRHDRGRREGSRSTSRNRTRYSDKQKAALAYAEAITWHLETDDAFWERLHQHFSEPELVELGCFIALTMGQQSWLRLLNIEHHQVLAGTAASMAPGYEDRRVLAEEQVFARIGSTGRKQAASS